MTRHLKTPGMTLGILFSLWLATPICYQAMHLCPMRPDAVRPAGAMPNFARRYGVDCSVCHTTVPELNRAGYVFRRAGFRMADEYGSEAKYNGLQDLYTARIREQFRINHKTGGTAPQDTNSFVFNELTVYPITGAIGKWWASETEVAFNPDETPEIENAYVRATVPHKDWLLTARAGIFHPVEGFGGGDRPISNIRPMFQTTTAKTGAFDTLSKLWNQDVQGAEIGATVKSSNLTLAVLNGLNWATGAADGTDDNRKRDYILNFVQLFGDTASFQAEYWNGNSTVTEDVTGATVAAFNNHFWKSVLYANYKILGDRLNLLGGYEFGRDKFANADGSIGSFMNNGWFMTVESKMAKHFTGAVRYDTFKPSRSNHDNRLEAYTLTGVIPFNEIKFLIDAQFKKTEKTTPVANQWERILIAEWMVIF
jgi:hypothetical protein